MSIAELMRETNDPKIMESWVDIIEEYSKKLPADIYCDLYDTIYETIYGEVLSDEKAIKLVEKMKPFGQKWTIAEVEAVLGGDFKPATKYYVMNMLYNDYFQLLGDDTNNYVKMATLWLNDEDSPGGDIKTYRYATMV